MFSTVRDQPGQRIDQPAYEPYVVPTNRHFWFGPAGGSVSPVRDHGLPDPRIRELRPGSSQLFPRPARPERRGGVGAGDGEFRPGQRVDRGTGSGSGAELRPRVRPGNGSREKHVLPGYRASNRRDDRRDGLWRLGWTVRVCDGFGYRTGSGSTRTSAIADGLDGDGNFSAST